jgi:hypothetical protein
LSNANDLPPWMRTDGAGPPPGGSTPPSYETDPPRPSGLLTFVAVVNLIYALGCGCIGGFYSGSFVFATSPELLQALEQEQGIEAMQEQFETNPQFRQKTSGLDDDDRRRLALGIARASGVAVRSIAGDPGFQRLRTAAVAGSVAHLAIFIGAILLLMRRPFGWWASVLGCLAFVAATSFTIATGDGVAQEFEAAFASAVQSTTKRRCPT